MNNIILKLENIKGLGYKSIDYIINNFELNIKDEKDLEEILINAKLKNNRIEKINLEDIKIGFNNSEKILKISEKLNIKNVSILSKKYPKNLKSIKNPPHILFYKGNFEILNKDNIAIIGTRKSSYIGNQKSYNISKILSNDYNIVSGLAVGIDTYAHIGCVDNNKKSIAVLPCSLDKIYPVQNAYLLDKIIENNGIIVSEYFVGQKMNKGNFINRDRIQSGLSKCVVLIECTENSGSMHTINFAKEQKRLIAVCESDYEGNKKVIKEFKDVFIIDNNSNLDKLKSKVRDFKIKKEYDTKQISFLLSNYML